KATLNPATGAGTTATALAAGTTNIRAQAGGRQATATLTVNPPPPVLTKVELTPTTATIITGQTQQFTARALDQFDQPFTGASYSFNSDDTNVAQIVSTTNNADGSVSATVSGHGVGTAHIKATATSGATVVMSDAATLTITPPTPVITQIVVSPASATINRGQTQQFTAQAFDQNGQPLVNVSFTWTTSDTLVATVNADGLAHGVGIGAVNISATAADGAGGTVGGQATLNVRAPLVINEILADVPPDNVSTQNVEGDANRDGVRSSDDDEFVELFNYSDAALDLSGVVVADATANRFTFPANTVLAAGRAVVIFGGGNPPVNDPAFGGALIITTGSLGLNDGGDTVTVKLPTTSGDIVLAAQSFGSAANNMPPAPSDQSLTGAPDAALNDSGGAFVAHTNVANANGRVFSPGTRADGTPYGAPTLTRLEIAPSAAQLDIGAHQTFSARAFANINGAETEVANVSFIWDAGDATKAALAPQTGASTKATALAAGTTTVRARAGTQQASATLTINPPPPVLTRVALTPTTATIITGQTQQFTA